MSNFRLAENTLTISQAKRRDVNFDIVTEKSEVCEMWITPEVDYGFGYDTAKLVKKTGNVEDIYILWLDGEPSDVWYAIFDNGSQIALEPTHWHED